MVLECLSFAQSHSANNLVSGLRSVFDDFEIAQSVHLIVRDNTANIVKAMRVGGWNNVGCFLHGLHLVVVNSLKPQISVNDMLAKVRNIVRTFHHSMKAKTLLGAAQEKENLPKHAEQHLFNARAFSPAEESYLAHFSRHRQIEQSSRTK